jgi:hypothetical protein
MSVVHLWNDIAGESRSTSTESWSNATLFIANPTWTDLGSKPNIRFYITFGDWIITLVVWIVVLGDGKLTHHSSQKT